MSLNTKSNICRFAITSTLALGLIAAAGCSQERYEDSKWDQGSGSTSVGTDATTLPSGRGTTLPGGSATTLPGGRGVTTLPSGATTLP